MFEAFLKSGLERIVEGVEKNLELRMDAFNVHYERHMLRQLYDLRDDARKPVINTELWTRLIMNINI